MAAEGQNKAASSLLDLQPTAVLELFRIYPDRVNKPTMFVGFHGGAIFDKAIKWQGLQYIPIAIESEGFDLLGDGKLARPKIRTANKNNIITNLLQNYKDFKHAKVIRKKVQVKFLDDDNFDGGNPFGLADDKAELLDEEWLMGRKTQESKLFVEFELTSPLDLENFDVNSRGIQARFCYWQYRGEGCRYQGLPIERENGEPFQDTSDNIVIPNYAPPSAPSTDPATVQAQTNFWSDPSVVWNENKEYSIGNIVIRESAAIILPLDDVNAEGVPLKTIYVSVANSNKGNSPEKNPSFWQKDGCTKKLGACQKRFNPLQEIVIPSKTPTEQSFPSVRFSGIDNPANPAKYNANSGYFHTTESGVTGALDPRKEWTLVGWANMNENSPRGAGIFSTSAGEGDGWPASRFININRCSRWGWRFDDKYNVIQAQYLGYFISNSDGDSAWTNRSLGKVQMEQAENDEWNQYIVRHSTGTKDFLDNDAALARNEQGGDTETFTTKLEVLLNGEEHQYEGIIPRRYGDWWGDLERVESNDGNFASWADRVQGYHSPDDIWYPCLPQTFMLGAQEFWRFEESWPNPTANPPVLNQPAAQIATMNGHIGMWALWNRALNDEEIKYLKKPLVSPYYTATTYYDNVPRPYNECTGRMSTLTGGTGDGLPDGTAPLLYGHNRLVAWWSGTTGLIPTTAIVGLLDGHTGGHHLTGSGNFSGVAQSYDVYDLTIIPNPSPPYPRFGGFPGTDGFSYGRTAY